MGIAVTYVIACIPLGLLRSLSYFCFNSRSFKPSVNPAAVGTGSVKQGTHCRSYSPGSRPKTSPAGISASPQRNDMSPAAKSPLLGPAPPGLLPPPDKGT